jgi:hypothetical protein
MIEEKLSLPPFSYRIKKKEGKVYIFDPLRKKYVHLSPEEWVRQHIINYLVEHRAYPPSLMVVERTISATHKRLQRADLLIYGRHHKPVMLVECKAPNQKLSKEVIEQMMRYNSDLIPWLLFTNGKQHFCFRLDTMQKHYVLLQEIPSFAELS